MPDHLLRQVALGNAVIFAGAGVSTETRAVMSRYCDRAKGLQTSRIS